GRIREQLEGDRLIVAEELLERVRDGEPLPDRAPPGAGFDEFFPQRAAALYDDLKIGRFKDSFAGQDLDEPRAEALVDAWSSARQNADTSPELIASVLERLGFEVEDSTVESSSKRVT
ncbi:MAG: hypothetical protein ABEL76_08740, partial [Bradymonadaceae bacterium]